MKDKKQLRLWIIAGLAVLAVTAATISLLVATRHTPTDAEIYVKFRCNRVTLEVLATDTYCVNPDQYRQDLKNGTVIKNR